MPICYDKDMNNQIQSGYALVELLSVVLIIGLLASIAIPVFNGEREKSKMAKARADLNLLGKAVVFSRETPNGYKTLKEINGNGYTANYCVTAYPQKPKDLPKTHACWTTYKTSLQRLEQESGVDLSSLYNGDAWGAPYAIDENEGEFSDDARRCNKDSIGIYQGTSNPTSATPQNGIRVVYTIPTASNGCNDNSSAGLR